MKNSKLVSIIIPTYRRNVSLISRAVYSAIQQSYDNVEVILVDDNAGEDDLLYRNNNLDFVKTNLGKTKKVKLVINKNNLGGALSRNEGIKKSSGYYVTFLDDDDYFLKDKVLHQVNFMEENSLDFSFTDLHIYNIDNKLIDIRDRSDIKSFDNENLLKYHIVKNLTGTETFMGKRDLFLSIHGFDDSMTGHEFYLMIKILETKGTKIGYFKSADIVAYRTSLASISNGPKKIEGEKLIYEKRKEYFNLLNRKEKKYVRCRHYAVLGVAYLRRRNFLKGFIYSSFSLLISPKTVLVSIFTKKR